MQKIFHSIFNSKARGPAVKQKNIPELLQIQTFFIVPSQLLRRCLVLVWDESNPKLFFLLVLSQILLTISWSLVETCDHNHFIKPEFHYFSWMIHPLVTELPTRKASSRQTCSSQFITVWSFQTKPLSLLIWLSLTALHHSDHGALTPSSYQALIL